MDTTKRFRVVTEFHGASIFGDFLFKPLINPGVVA